MGRCRRPFVLSFARVRRGDDGGRARFARLRRPAASACAALLTFILIAGSVYQSYFTTVVKTYSLCALFLVGGLLALSYAARAAAGWPVSPAGILLAFSAGTRLSAGVALPVAGLYLLFMRRHFGDSRWLSFAVGGALGLCAISLPFLKLAPDGFWFGLFEYHSQRIGGRPSAGADLQGRFRFAVRAGVFPARLPGGGASFFSGGSNLREPRSGCPERFHVVLWLVGLAVTLVHFVAPFPYEDYQVMVYPVFAAALAGSLISECRISDFGSMDAVAPGFCFCRVRRLRLLLADQPELGDLRPRPDLVEGEGPDSAPETARGRLLDFRTDGHGTICS